MTLLVPLHLGWANVHGFVVVGLALVGGYAVYRLACRLARGRIEGWLPARDAQDLRATWLVAIGCVGAAMVNVAGPKLFAGPLKALPDIGRARIVSERSSPTMRAVDL